MDANLWCKRNFKSIINHQFGYSGVLMVSICDSQRKIIFKKHFFKTQNLGILNFKVFWTKTNYLLI